MPPPCGMEIAIARHQSPPASRMAALVDFPRYTSPRHTARNDPGPAGCTALRSSSPARSVLHFVSPVPVYRLRPWAVYGSFVLQCISVRGVRSSMLLPTQRSSTQHEKSVALRSIHWLILQGIDLKPTMTTCHLLSYGVWKAEPLTITVHAKSVGDGILGSGRPMTTVIEGCCSPLTRTSSQVTYIQIHVGKLPS